MTSVDPTLVVGQIQALSTTLSGLGQSLAQAAPTGGFSSVLDAVQREMEAIGQPAVPVTGSGAMPFVSTAGLLGGGPAPAGAPSGSQVVSEAARFLGVPYQWGGTSPSTGFDCSGLVQYVYRQLGISLPRTSEEQALVGTRVASLATARPGDLVFFPGSDGTAAAPGHVGIYVGNGMMIDAPYTGTDVQIQPVSSAGTPVAIRRIVATHAPPAGGSAVPSALAPLFSQAAATYGVPAALLTAVARHESGFNTSAVSTAGAEGLMQIMPATAAGLGVTPFTPRQAIDGAAQILAGDLGRFRSVPLALAAYNAGAGAVEAYGGVPPYAQTQSYVADIMRTLAGSG